MDCCLASIACESSLLLAKGQLLKHTIVVRTLFPRPELFLAKHDFSSAREVYLGSVPRFWDCIHSFIHSKGQFIR